jgi:uncharacterized membrane protein
VQAELILLRLIHVVGGVFWVGSVMFTTFFLMPTLMKAGPMVAGPVSAGLQARRMMTWMPVVALLVILSGLRLMMIVSAGDAHWFAHRAGHAYAVSGALAIIAFIVGFTVTRPAMTRAGKLAQSAASDQTSKQLIQEEVKRLQRRGAFGTMVVTWLVIVAAAGMAIARYL